MLTRSFQITLGALIATAITTSIWAQSYQGGLRGIVLDSGGGIVASAKVTLVDEATSHNRATVTNASGEYVSIRRHFRQRRPIPLVIFPALFLTGDQG